MTIVLGGVQFRYLGYAMKIALGRSHTDDGKGDISHYQALMTSLAATIGIGNIAGVSTALVVGGHGALFWMWVTALLGMATKYAEAFLAIRFRHVDSYGEMVGGPMFFIEQGLKWHWLAFSFALFGVISSFGGGNMLQANSIADALYESASMPHWITGCVVAAIVGLTIVGGIRWIGAVAGWVVPIMAIVYFTGSLVILALHIGEVPQVIVNIFKHAFTGQAAAGGFLGASLIRMMQVGVSRGLMTSESGLGTASIAAAAAKTDVPGRQALVSMTSSFFATIIMCSVTALVLGVAGVFGELDQNGKLITGVALTMRAFTSELGIGGHLVTISTLFFGFTTLIGWAYYGEKCVEYFFGEKSIYSFRVIYSLCIIPGAVLDLDVVWKFSDIANGLMAVPNLIGILALSKLVVEESKAFTLKVDQETNSKLAR
jgi:AGCS family alanine or glycine:cation symporter